MTLENLMNLNEPILNTCYTDLFNFIFQYHNEILFNDNDTDNEFKFPGNIDDLNNLRKLIMDLNKEKNEMFLLK